MRSRGGRRRGVTRALRNLVVLVVAVVAIALLVGAVLQSRAQVSAAKRQSAMYTVPPLTTPSPAALPIVSVIGDDTVTSTASGVEPSDQWTAIVAADREVDVRTFASPDASYTSGGEGGRSFLQQASRIPADSSLVILFGGARDVGEPALRVSRAVSQTIAAVQYRAPKATVVVVGPVTSDSASADDLTELRTNLQNSSGAFDVRFVDPVQQAWLNTRRTSGTDLTQADEETLARHVATIVAQLLPDTTG